MEKTYADLRGIDRRILASENLKIDAIAKAKLINTYYKFKKKIH